MSTQVKIGNSNFLKGLLILFLLVFTYGNAQILDANDNDVDKPEIVAPVDIYWHVKAFRPEAKLLRVKAIDGDGNLHDVKAIQTSDNTTILNVKAIVNGKKLSVKMLTKGPDDRFYPVKAITDDGTILKIKAITDDGEILDVKGFSKTGNVVHLRAVTKDFKYYNIIAISPTGEANTVKGVKMMSEEVEAIIHDIPIYAHIKAIKQN